MPITYQPPAEKIETFTVSGTGTYVLTEEQRSSRRLSILVELVRAESGPPFYYDFRVPEPRTFWGNVQTVSRDYIRGTMPLQFRRHVIHEFDNHLVEQLHQLRCLVTALGLDITENLLQARRQLGLAQADAQVWYENLIDDIANPTLRPVEPITALWYEIMPLMFAQVTVIWQGYAVQCNDGGFIAFQPPPRATAKDEQRPAPSGGGSQPAIPLPDGRKTDPLSDSPAPPPTSPSGPPSPVPGPPPFTGRARVVWGNGKVLLDNCTEAVFGPITIDVTLPTPSSVVAVGTGNLGLLYNVCGFSVYDRRFFITVDGVAVGQSYGPAKFTVIPQLISVTPI